ncbi:MAG: hypothetical protein RIS26_1081 [Actinomycetota bacterium]|jgi:uncharacterized membrane protein
MSKSKDRLDAPIGTRSRFPRLSIDQEKFGRASEAFARAMGTGSFLIGMTIFCFVWLAWNTFAPVNVQFDPRLTNFTLLTLILSMQASYAAPLILLAQNRQDDRDRVKFEQDRQRAERNLADTEYLAREVVALRLAMEEMATKEFVKDELRDLMRELVEELKDTKPARTKKSK